RWLNWRADRLAGRDLPHLTLQPIAADKKQTAPTGRELIHLKRLTSLTRQHSGLAGNHVPQPDAVLVVRCKQMSALGTQRGQRDGTYFGQGRTGGPSCSRVPQATHAVPAGRHSAT